MSRRRRGLVWLLTLAGVGMIAWLSARLLQLDVLTPSRADRPQVALDGPRLSRYDPAGRKLWELRARRIQWDEEGRIATAGEVELRFWRGDGRPGLSLTVRADRLRWEAARGDLHLEGDVRAHDEEGLTFMTPRARWRDREKVLEGDGPVLIVRDDLRLEGVGFRYDTQGGTFTVLQEARLRWVPLPTDTEPEEAEGP